ncbi:MAG TPA: hypothetical protein D7I09_07975, partial [Candidatus Poseidoniales archaeon]
MAPRGRYAAVLLVLLMVSMPWAPAAPATLTMNEPSTTLGTASTIVIGGANGGHDDRVEVEVDDGR